MIKYNNTFKSQYFRAISLTTTICSNQTGEILEDDFFSYDESFEDNRLQFEDALKFAYVDLYKAQKRAENNITKYLLQHCIAFIKETRVKDVYCTDDKSLDCVLFDEINDCLLVNISLYM